MTDSLSFINVNWFWYVVIIAVLGYTIFAIKEWLQSRKSQFFIKLVVIFLTISALSMIALKPAITVDKDISRAIILTHGYNEQTLDSLKRLYPNIEARTYTTGKQIFKHSKQPTSAFILGEGLAEFDFWQLQNTETLYIGNSYLSGITRLKYNQNQTIGETVVVKGHYSNPKKGHKLVLENSGLKPLDSTVFASENDTIFNLKANLNVTGNYVYSISEKDSIGQVITRNPLPIKIKDRSLLKVLIINRFPTFETKYIKNYLAEKGHEIVVRSQITKGRFKYEYFNLQDRPQTSLTVKNLKSFDLVIIDGNSLLNLSRTQRLELTKAIKNDGLGLFIQPTSTLFKSNNNLSPFQFRFNKQAETTIPNAINTKVSKYSYVFKEDDLLHPIHTLNTSILSGYKRLEAGRIGTTVYNNTFELILSGKTKAYGTLWSDIINAISKRTSHSIEWSSESAFGVVDEPFHFNLRTDIEQPLVKHNASTVPIAQDIDVSSLWKGKTYPRNLGWNIHYVEQDSSHVFEYYVTDATQWKNVRAYATMLANNMRFNKTYGTSIVQTEKQPINLLWFFLVFLLGSGFLWLEPKL